MDTGPYVTWPSDCSQVRWSLRSTQAVAAAGQELRVVGPGLGVLGVGVLAATASGVGRAPGEDTPIAAARTFACSASGSCLTRDAAFPGAWPPCQPTAVVPATSIKAKTAVSL